MMSDPPRPDNIALSRRSMANHKEDLRGGLFSFGHLALDHVCGTSSGGSKWHTVRYWTVSPFLTP